MTYNPPTAEIEPKNKEDIYVHQMKWERKEKGDPYPDDPRGCFLSHAIVAHSETLEIKGRMLWSTGYWTTY